MTGRDPSFGCVILTAGQRPAGVQRAVASVLAQTSVELDVAVVWNGCPVEADWAGVRSVPLAVDDGIPGARNAGVPHVRGELLLFLDDDAELSDPSMLASIGSQFAAAPDLGALQPRVQDRSGRRPPRRWVPRLLVGDRARSSDVCALWEGCVVVRRSVFERAGGWPAAFRYMHEGIDLAWRIWDCGHRVRYDGSLAVWHDVVSSGRHPGGARSAARNRVWLARRNLPAVIAPLYVLNWVALSLLRLRTRDGFVQLRRGVTDGLRTNGGPRRPIRWRTIWRMTKAGRPPII